MPPNQTPPDWADPLVTGRNRVLTHSPLGAYPDAHAARSCDRTVSPFMQSLNGTWRFRLTPSPEREPRGFRNPDMDDSAWHTSVVPSNWQLDPAIKDQPIYTNESYPFCKMPPEPPKVNPTGWYRQTFKVPASWKGREVFLQFESCDSACKVWVNGAEAGYSQDSKLPHEFNITSLVRPGKNHLAVMVPRYCDGFWLECQDYWHLSGIQRDVWLYSKPKAHIRDFVVRTTFDAGFRDADLSIRVFMNEVDDLAEGYRVTATLYAPDGKPVPGAKRGAPVALNSPIYPPTGEDHAAACIQFPVEAPSHWTAETPELYTLVLTLKNPAGKAIDFESCRVGFRQVDIRDRQLLLNGKRLIVRGVNLHEHHPQKGRALTLSDMRRELIAMKRLNINAVRTSHYPHHSAFYDLCDELGIMVVDEANLETHGVRSLLSRDPAWMNAYMERAQRMALRDKNHPCIIVWSLGNESSLGPHHAAMAAWLRYYDPTRPVQYESGCPGPAISDIMCPMYPGLDWVDEVMRDATETRPMIMCEYAYSKGNTLGNLYKYWDAVSRWKPFQGGFVWEWADKALVRTVDGRKEWAYGNEFDGGIGPDGFNYGEHENPQMVLDGLVLPDLTPKPGAYELKQVQAPVAFGAENQTALLKGCITVQNRYIARDLSHLGFAWELTRDGEILESGVLPGPDVPAGGTGTLVMPWTHPSGDKATGELRLNVRAQLDMDMPWAPKGHVIAWDQFDIPPARRIRSARKPAGPHPPLSHTERDGKLCITDGDTSLTFDPNRGVLTTFLAGGEQLLTRPLEHAFMRARTDNDYALGKQNNYYDRWQAAGLDQLQTQVLEWTMASADTTAVVIRCVTRHAASRRTAGIVCETTYTVSRGAVLLIENTVTVEPGLPVLPRIGMRAGINGRFEQLHWYGRGPHESYADRKRSALIGRYDSTVDAQFFPFIDPCECGGHEDTRWVSLIDRNGTGLTVTGQPVFHFSVLHYTVEDLIQAGHVYELHRTDDIQLHIDGFHMGLGGDTGWTPNVYPEFLLPPGTYRYGFRLQPGLHQ